MTPDRHPHRPPADEADDAHVVRRALIAAGRLVPRARTVPGLLWRARLIDAGRLRPGTTQ